MFLCCCFFQVSSIYKDPSIGNLINIVIVKLVIINNELVRILNLLPHQNMVHVPIIYYFFLCPSQEGPVISFNAQTTLKNFCIWQQGQNVLDDNHHSHHDTAILITRCRRNCGGFHFSKCKYFVNQKCRGILTKF